MLGAKPCDLGSQSKMDAMTLAVKAVLAGEETNFLRWCLGFTV